MLTHYLWFCGGSCRRYERSFHPPPRHVHRKRNNKLPFSYLPCLSAFLCDVVCVLLRHHGPKTLTLSKHINFSKEIVMCVRQCREVSTECEKVDNIGNLIIIINWGTIKDSKKRIVDFNSLTHLNISIYQTDACL